MALPNLTCHSETLNQAKQWVADNRSTFERVSAPGNEPWGEMLPTFESSNPNLAGLLVMGVAGRAFKFSFGERGFPKNASREVTEVFLSETNHRSPSYLTRQDMESKLSELMIISDQNALTVQSLLSGLIKSLPEHTGDPRHQRIVFWFT